MNADRPALNERLSQILTRQRARSEYRERLVLEGPQGVEISVDGGTLLSFCSNDYLGLANHPQVAAAMQEGVRRYGAGSGASHLISGHSRAHHELEEELAAFTGRPRAVLFSTGYMANLGVISALLQGGDTAYEDRLNHASLIDGALLGRVRLRRYPHRDPGALSQWLEKDRGDAALVASDGVFSMDGDTAPLAELAGTARRHGAWLMVDDAHGLGVTGAGGRGTLECHDCSDAEVPILMGTLGKAFGTFGAFVAGSDDLIRVLIQRARTYIYTTALPPAVAHATRTSLRLAQEEPWRRSHLHALIKRLRAGLGELRLPAPEAATPIQPLEVGDAGKALALSRALQRRGMLVPAIRPPTVPQGRARLRITLCADHSEAHVDRLIDALAELV